MRSYTICCFWYQLQKIQKEMGQTSCCHPNTYSTEFDILSLPKEAVTLEPFEIQATKLFQQPSQQILQTLKEGEQYLRKLNKQLTISSAQTIWASEIKIKDKKQVIFCRGGEKQKSFNGPIQIYFPNHQVFKGVVQNNKPIFGVFVFRHNCYYSGQMKGFNAEGQGKFKNEDSGYTYEGKWCKSLPHQQGEQIYSNGDSYKGKIIYGSKFGYGTYSFSNGNIYTGSFYYNQTDGFGKMVYKQGDHYEGQWKLGKFQGKGIFVWKNGQKYDGEYIKGKRQGFGKYTFKNGSIYEGRWKNGVQSGEGTLRDKYDQIKGVWQQGELIS